MADHQRPSPAGLVEPPADWDAEAKARFAQLPRDLQEVIQRREAQRATVSPSPAGDELVERLTKVADDLTFPPDMYPRSRDVQISADIRTLLAALASERSARQAAEDIAASEKASAASWCIRAQAAEAERERLRGLAKALVRVAEERILAAYTDGFRQAIGKEPWEDMHDYTAVCAKEWSDAYRDAAIDLASQQEGAGA